jgi:ABC-2 type transport system ATP-binding protein
MTFLELRQVRKGRNGRCIVWDASASLSDDIYLIEGVNGVGKTTLLEVMCGLEDPTSGDVLLDGYSVHSRRSRGASRIVMVPAAVKFYDGASVDFAIRLYLSLRGVAIPRDLFEAFDPFLLKGHARVPFGDLSLGWKRRLMLHMAFAAESDVLVLDEPTVGLDADGVERLADLMLRRIGTGITIVTCHEPVALKSVPMRQYVLKGGGRGSVLVSPGHVEPGRVSSPPPLSGYGGIRVDEAYGP